MRLSCSVYTKRAASDASNYHVNICIVQTLSCELCVLLLYLLLQLALTYCLHSYNKSIFCKHLILVLIYLYFLLNNANVFIFIIAVL